MPTLLDYVALSLLPLKWWGEVATALRAGESPAALLGRLIAERPQLEPLDPVLLRERAAGGLARAAARRIDVVAWNSADYPVSLSTIHDPPPALWVSGQIAALHQPGVAIVGSRAGSPYALEVARELAADLARRGVVVVSGLARGVDSAAHRGALTMDARDDWCPRLGRRRDVSARAPNTRRRHGGARRHRQRAAAGHVAAGALLSEAQPNHQRPRARGRRDRSGSEERFIDHRALCARQGRDVLAVPGTVLGGRNRGGHALLRDGAKIVESADDIVEELGLGRIAPGAGVKASKGTSAPTDDPVLQALAPGEPADLDEISERTGLLPPRLLPRLLELELLGSVRRVGGGRFVRFDRPC
jgi:DNA processing protein